MILEMRLWWWNSCSRRYLDFSDDKRVTNTPEITPGDPVKLASMRIWTFLLPTSTSLVLPRSPQPGWREERRLASFSHAVKGPWLGPVSRWRCAIFGQNSHSCEFLSICFLRTLQWEKWLQNEGNTIILTISAPSFSRIGMVFIHICIFWA